MKRLHILSLLVAAAALSGCEFVGSAVAPSVTGGAGSAAGGPSAIIPLDVSRLGQPSGTSAGVRVAKFRTDLAQLQQAAIQAVQRGRQLQADMDASVATYQIAIGTIDSSRQSGAGPEASAAAWRNAQAQLQTISTVLDRMSGLSSEVAKNVAFAAFLRQSIRDTNSAPDATDQDRQQLKILEDSTTQTATSLDQLLGGLRQEVLEQSHFLGTEGAKLAQIAPPSAGTPVNVAGSPPPVQQPAHVAGAAGAGLATGRPFVVIRFDNPGVEYEQQLYEAVSAALARSPNVAFDLVGAAPATGTPEDSEAARASMERVRQSLVNMGLPPDRVSISQLTDPAIQSNEVRLYVR